MNVRVEPNRFLSVACDPDERIVFDRKETKYHLLRDSAARLWDEICEGGTFEVAPVTEGEDPIAMLAEAGLLGFEEATPSDGITRRVWLRRTGKVSAAAVVLPLVATITTPTLSLAQGDVSIDDASQKLPEIPETDLEEPSDLEAPSNNGTRTRTRTRGGDGNGADHGLGQDTSTNTPTRTRTRTGQPNEGFEDLSTYLRNRVDR